MLEENKNMVYFSNLFARHYPALFKEIKSILQANNTPCETIKHTKDYWCRDYMPIQCNNGSLAQFIYAPDYLHGDKRYITDTDNVFQQDGQLKLWPLNKRTHYPLIFDGGNLTIVEKNQERIIIVTSKIQDENPKLSVSEIETILKNALCSSEQQSKIVWIPWDKKDKCGHTDGLVRYIKDGMVLTNLQNYSKTYADKVRTSLNKHFEVVELQLSQYDDRSWAYLNFIQTKDIIIIPGLGTDLDNEALHQIQCAYNGYEGKVYMVEMGSFVKKWNGALNCLSWTLQR